MSQLLVSAEIHDSKPVRSIPKAQRLEAVGLWMLVGNWCASSSPQMMDFSRDLPEQLTTDPAISDSLERCGLWCEGRAAGRLRMGHGPDSTFALWDLRRTDYRRKISNSLRMEIYGDDGWACAECGARDDLTLDHIFPWSRGGSDAASNLRTLCRPCNSHKGARITQGVARDAL